MSSRFRGSRSVITTCAAVLAGSASCASTESTIGAPDSVELQTLVQLETLSNRADLISGGDALVEAVLHQGLSFRQLSITIGTRNVTGDFAVRADGRIVGLITGLAEGPNRVIARL